jgi:hypothetical protein
MKMFLVGMSDVFVILYLTTLGQSSDVGKSKLTVSDYRQLEIGNKQAAKALEEKSQLVDQLHRELDLLKQSGAKELLKRKSLDESLGSLQEKLLLQAKELEQEKFKSANENAAVKALSAKLAEQEQRNVESLKAEQAARESERLELAAQIDNEKQRLAAMAADRDRLGQTLAADREASAQEKQLLTADAEKLKAELAALEAAKADALAQLSSEQDNRLVAEVQAREAQALALKNAQEREDARTAAYQSKLQASLERADKKVAQEAAQKAQGVLDVVTRDSGTAYRNSVLTRTFDVEVFSKIENTLIGSSEQKLTLKSIPLVTAKGSFLFFPAEQVGIDSATVASRVRQLELSVGGLKAAEICGINLAGKFFLGLRSTKAFANKALEEMSPVLFVVRNGARLPFADRWRDQRTDYVTIRRDSLIVNGRTASFQAEGSRGTGDYAVRVVAGDTIVDMAGNVIGYGVDTNKVALTSSAVSVQCVSGAQPAQDIVRRLRG